MAATNILQNGSFESGTTAWNFPNDGSVVIDGSSGQQTSGTASALFDPGDTLGQEAELYQTFPTTPGSNYIVQFDYETLDSSPFDDQYMEVYVSGTNIQPLLYVNPNPTTHFQTSTNTFVASGTSATIELYGEDNIVYDNVIVYTGSFSEPGKYSGKVKVTGTLPLESIASFHTESVVARISPTGGISWIQQPSWISNNSEFEDTINLGSFITDSSLAVSGTTVPVSIKTKTHVSFTETFSNTNGIPPLTDILTFTLHKVGK